MQSTPSSISSLKELFHIRYFPVQQRDLKSNFSDTHTRRFLEKLFDARYFTKIHFLVKLFSIFYQVFMATQTYFSSSFNHAICKYLPRGFTLSYKKCSLMMLVSYVGSWELLSSLIKNSPLLMKTALT